MTIQLQSFRSFKAVNIHSCITAMKL